MYGRGHVVDRNEFLHKNILETELLHNDTSSFELPITSTMEVEVMQMGYPKTLEQID